MVDFINMSKSNKVLDLYDVFSQFIFKGLVGLNQSPVVRAVLHYVTYSQWPFVVLQSEILFN